MEATKNQTSYASQDLTRVYYKYQKKRGRARRSEAKRGKARGGDKDEEVGVRKSQEDKEGKKKEKEDDKIGTSRADRRWRIILKQ